MELCEKIKLAREKQNLTKTELAKKIGIRCAAIISSWEAGDSQPTTMTSIKNLSTILDISLYDLFDMEPPKETILSGYQADIVSKLKFLDSAAEKRIMDVVNEEYNRCNTHSTTDPILFQIKISEPLFIDKTNPKYDEIKKKVRVLKKERKKRELSASSITHFLWMIGFNNYISIAQVCAIFCGALVPSEQLYNCLNSYVLGTYKKTPEDFFNKFYER